MLESIDGLIAGFVPPLQQMGYLLSEQVNLIIPGSNQANMTMGTAAALAFILPWVDNLGAICTALAKFMEAL